MALNPRGPAALETTPLFCGHLIQVNDRQMEADGSRWKQVEENGSGPIGLQGWH
jgi:hypothetical protein